MRKKLWLCAAMFLSIALLGSGLIPQISQLITKGAEVVTMKQNKQDDFTYVESFENYDKTDIRYRAQIDLNWKFLQDDEVDASAKDFDDSSWRLLNLPHDWSIEGEYDQSNPSGGSGGYLPTGIGWYRKTLTIPEEWWDGRQVSIAFDGVFTNSTVYVDGEKVGGMEYGWLSFSCDITEQVQGKDSVVVAVKVDNSVQPAARWYTGSGIYSHVWILSTENIHVAENGTYVTTPADEGGVPTGAMNLETLVKNEGSANADITVRSTVYKKSDNAQVAQVVSSVVTVPAGGDFTVTQTANVTNPQLWDTEHPNLYYIETEILSETTVLDDYITEFGFRAVTYDVNGLYLNGENIELKGVANHWALGAVGAAQSDNIIRYKIQMMKNMGVNCIRTAHNACPPTFYQLCNEMGMMVLDEFSEGERGKVAGDYATRWFQTYWQRDVEYWIRRDRNHPCVVVWSIGNETGSDNDNTGISDFIHQFDTTRPTTGSAIHYGVDIPGANGQSEPASFTQPVSTLPLIATEAPHTHAVRGVYRTQTWFRGRFSETGSGNTIPNLTDSEIFKYDWSSTANGARIWPSDYDNATSQVSVREHWVRTRDEGWRIGEFRWTGFDYLGEANYVLGGWPYRMFHSGAVDTALFEKDMYYLYQSMWLDEPMLRILPSWTHPMMEEGTEIPVWVYSNCEKVELFFNDQSLGLIDRGPVDERDKDSIQFDWLVPYKAGTITAVGYDADGNEILRESYTTASAPAAITLENATGEELPTDPSWVGQVTVSTVDKDGNFYPYGENRTYYYVSGPAYIKAADNGSPTDTESHVNYNRNAFMGLSKVFVSPTQDSGDILFTAASILGEKRQLTSNLVCIDVQQIALRGNPAKNTFEIYYTLDGSTPTKSSNKYTGAFEVELGTTVKAAVYTAGSDAPMFVMEEAFGEDEGMYWQGTGSSATAENVYSANDAVVTGDTLKKVPYGYEDVYVDFDNGTGTVEYTVNAPKAGNYYVAVCYNNGSGTTGNYKTLSVLVNGTSIGNQTFYYNGAWGSFWTYHILNVTLAEGENKIKFDSGTAVGPNLKQISVWAADDVYSASEAVLTGDDTLDTYISSFDDRAADVHSGGTITWTVTDKPAGLYNLYFWYSTPNSGLREVSGIVNGETVAVWAGQKTSPNYGSTWGYCTAEVSIAPGTNTLSVTVPTGGTLVGAMVLEPVKEYTEVSYVIDASCVEDVRLGAAVTAPILTGTDVMSEDTVWETVTNDSGLIWLVNRASGKLLTCDGTSLSLSDGETDGNAQWQRTGEAENYDYIVHVKSGKILAVDANGNLILDVRENYEDSNMTTHRAFWYFHTPSQIDFAFADGTPLKKTVDSKPFLVSASGGEGTVTYSVVSGPATVDKDSGLVTLTGQTGTVVLKATLTGTDGTFSVTHSIVVTESDIARDSGIIVLPGAGTPSEEPDASASNPFSMKTTQGVTYWNFGGGGNGRSVSFTVNAERAGSHYMAIRYNSKNARTLIVTVNGTAQTVSVVQNSASWGDSDTATNIIWSYHIITVDLKQGENTVVIGMNGTAGAPMFSDLRFWSVNEWHTAADNPILSSGVTQISSDSGFDDLGYDVGQNGSLSWNLTVPVSGTYKITGAYSTSASDTGRPVKFLVNGTTVDTLTRTATGTAYGNAWDFLTSQEVTLEAGETTVSLQCPGGSYLGGVRLELVKEADVDFDLTWSDMTFTYEGKTWNPDTHAYEGGGWVHKSGNSTTDAIVKISNVGLKDLTVSLRYGKKAGYTDYSVSILTDGIAAPALSSVTSGKSLTYEIVLDAPAPTEKMDAVPVGTLNLSIAS